MHTVDGPQRARRPGALARALARVLAGVLLAAVAACGDRALTSPRVEPGPPAPAPPTPLPTPAPPGTPPAFAAIDSARARGQLTDDEALVQQLWAAVGDPRLAERFRGPGGTMPPGETRRLTLVLRRLAARLTALPEATRREVAPFFQPPAYQGSAWTARVSPRPAQSRGPRASASSASASGAGASSAGASGSDRPAGPWPILSEGWTPTDAASVPVRVWSHPEYSQGQVTPAQVIAAFENPVWRKLTTLMGREPVPDANPGYLVNAPGDTIWFGNGGDGRLDVYLISPGRLGIRSGGAATATYPPNCDARPAFMMIDADLTEHPLHVVVAHEFMHVLQFAFSRTDRSCPDSWDESVAEWASHYVFPRWKLDDPQALLDDQSLPLHGGYGYWTWTFNAYLAHAHTPDLIRRTYERYEGLDESMTGIYAMELALPGGLARHWKEFARHAWNQEQSGRSFVGWEGLTTTPKERARGAPIAAASLELAAAERTRTWEVPAPPEELTRRYLVYGVTRGGASGAGAPGDSVRWLQFTNAHHGGVHASVQAYVKIRGRPWRHEDWSQRRQITWCYADAAERVDSLVVIQSDHRMPYTGNQLGASRLEARDACPAEPRVYTVEVRRWTTSDVYGIEYDMSYAAQLTETEPGSRSLTGSGAYRGTIFRPYPANCNIVPGEWPKEAVPQSGVADGTAFYSTRPDSTTWFGYSLVTKDWTWMPIYERHARTDDEREAAAGMGTISSGVNLLTLRGGSVAQTDTLAVQTSRCAGTVRSMREVRVTRMR